MRLPDYNTNATGSDLAATITTTPSAAKRKQQQQKIAQHSRRLINYFRIVLKKSVYVPYALYEEYRMYILYIFSNIFSLFCLVCKHINNAINCKELIEIRISFNLRYT